MKTIVGIDEVGRGPLAGPVTICVLACEEKIYKKLKRKKNLPPRGLDSKKLSVVEREKYVSFLKQTEVLYKIVHISNKTIDKIGISFAIKKAIILGIKKLSLDPRNSEILLDGSLKAPKEFTKQKTIIKGDEKEKIIAWASILAKVSRDALMVRLSKKHPKYGFHIHKGYGTEMHRKAIKRHGLSSFHRVTFVSAR